MIGAGSLVAGFVGASLLGQTISHHAGLTCNGKSCTSLGCNDTTSTKCQTACGNLFALENAQCVLKAAANKPVTIPKGVGTVNQFAPSIFGTTTTASQRLSPQDQDCADFGGSGLNAALGGIGEQACVASKSLQKGAQNFGSAGCGGIFTPVPVLGTLPCWAIIVGAVGIIFLGPRLAKMI